MYALKYTIYLRNQLTVTIEPGKIPCELTKKCKLTVYTYKFIILLIEKFARLLS